ncbi:NF-X1-type zinc finger protein NFXL1 [Nymphaea colorata]|uniref:NF-X1-type zinc finger protein NFXL1 n=1 Tax=Nymphaea colorata TaxID=210225 RepID=UPI00129E1EE7|nr:NF-X1-type zinc finger protein NFXL1 [Nymphaea colorata]
MRPSSDSGSSSRNDKTRGHHHHHHHHQQQSNGSNARPMRAEWVPKNTNPPTPAAAPAVPPPAQPVVPSASRSPAGILGRKPHQQSHNNPHHHHYHRKEPRRRLPDESLPQLVQELRDKLANGAVECMICYDNVGRSAPIWSCGACFCIFHLSCIKQWAKAPVSAAEGGGAASWRCPGCQSVQQMLPSELQYTCFCGKSRNPAHDFYLTPHSCGEPCGRPLGAPPCAHSCVLQCHPGPCPPCKAFAPACSCPCGRKSFVRRCTEGFAELSCGQPCGLLLACGRHRCKRVCHAGDCGSCEASIPASCFCEKVSDLSFSCNELDQNGKFSCNSGCGKLLGCGNHRCKKKCHSGPCGDCERAPSSIQSCPCGKMKLTGDRASCLDPIPCCSEGCRRLLPCGEHRCPEKCHEGDCPRCLILVSQRCRCGSSSRTVSCAERVEGMFLCEKPCGQKKNCGRHRCNEKCCTLSRSSSDGFGGGEDPHLCTVVCGKKLQCGKHFCTALCHSGHCPPCLETIFTDLSCACGKTYIPPPVPCGTPPPDCQLPCSVPQPCGHTASHSCHFSDCPPCAVPVAKECVGNHVVLRNVPCGSRDIRCNRLCGKTRQCGIHACTKICHPPPCDSLDCSENGSRLKVSCGQVCGAPRRDCRHTCAAICHPMAACPDIRCEFPVMITCSCERISATVPCGAGGNGVHVYGVFEASVIQNLPVPLVPLDTNSKRVVPLGQRKLVCDEECAKLERKKVLADAFDIPTNLDALHFGESSLAVSQLMADLMRREPKWVLAIEERFKYLVLSKGKGGNASGVRVHVFCPVNKEKRDAIRQIAERWKLSVSAAGWEPRRFLVVHVTAKSKAPSRILGCKGVATAVHPPAFDPSIDMDPRLVVGLFDLPRDADISGLVLRFGGECELVWLNDKNALAVFGDPARSATALRRLDHGSVYHGAVVILQNGGSSAGCSSGNAWSTKEKTGPDINSESWKKMVQGSAGWLSQDSWGGNEASIPAWKGKENPILASNNPWNVLETVDTVPSSTGSHESHQIAGNHVAKSGDRVPSASEPGEEVEDWEQAYD